MQVSPDSAGPLRLPSILCTRFVPNESVSYRGAIFYQTSFEKWARLNRVVAVFEYEVDPQGNTKAHMWEWK